MKKTIKTSIEILVITTILIKVISDRKAKDMAYVGIIGNSDGATTIILEGKLKRKY